MIPKFHNGQHVYFSVSVHAKSIASPGGETIIINQGTKGEVVSYSKEGTEENSADDFVGVEITDGDEAKGHTVWVPFSEFSKLHKI